MRRTNGTRTNGTRKTRRIGSALPALLPALLAMLGAAALAQGQEQEQGVAAQAEAARERAAVRVAHMATGGGAVDIVVDGEVAIADVTMGTVTGYVFVAAGEHELRLVPAGADPEGEAAAADPAAGAPVTAPADPMAAPADPMATPPATDQAGREALEPLVTQTVTLEAGTYTTIVATSGGEGGEGAATEGQEQAQQEQAQQEQSEAEQAETEQAEAEQAGTEQEQAEGAAAAGEAAAEGAAAEPGDAMDAAGAGEATDAASERVEISLTLLTDDLSLPEAGMALVRVVHASPDAPAVQVVAAPEEGTPAAPDAEQQQGQEQEQAEQQNQEQAEQQAQEQQTEGQAQEQQTEGQAQEQQTEGQQAEGAPAAATPAVPASAGPAGDGEAVSGTTLASDLAFGSASEWTLVPAGTYQVQVQDADGAVVVDLPGTVLTGGAAYTVYAYGTVADSGVITAISVDAGVSLQSR